MHDSGTENDLMLARMLQLQFDEEYEKGLKARENKMNGTSKGRDWLFKLQKKLQQTFQKFIVIFLTSQSFKVGDDS